MNIELPKDAEGREIPLDTVCMYDCNGDSISVTRWCFTTRLEPMFSEKNIWIAIDKEQLVKDPALLHLTPPDSWEKLLDDLDNTAEKASSSVYIAPCCAWFSGGDRRCDDCPANESSGVSCNVQLVNDISARIRKLMGEGEDE